MSELSTEQNSRRQRLVAEAFVSATEFINTYIRAQDYFVGYTTAEAIEERINQIGSDDKSTTQTFNGKLTKLAALNLFEATVKSALKAAIALGGVDLASYDKGVNGTLEDELDIPVAASDSKA